MERRPDGSFVIFRFGEDNSENVILNLPSALVSANNQSGSNSANSTSTAQPFPDNDSLSPLIDGQGNDDNNIARPEISDRGETAASGEGLTTGEGPDRSNGESSQDENIQRNMLVSVSYVYSNDGTTRASTDAGADPQRDRTGSLLLNVPNIPTNRSESQLNELIEFVASIALSAISFNLRRSHGITKEAFEKLSVKYKSEVSDTTCPICFEEYIEKEVKLKEVPKGKEAATKSDDVINEQGKRRRSDEDVEDSESLRKIRRTEHIHQPINNNGQSSSEPTYVSEEESLGPKPEEQEEYEHVPVVLPCNHTFGRNCLYEWLKTKATCPLCRQSLSEETVSTNTTPDRISIPNIISLLNPPSRGGPVVIVLDRSTNTLRARSDDNGSDGGENPSGINTNTPEASAASSLLSVLTRQRGIPRSAATPPRRDPLSASVFRELDQPPASSGLFTSGVASRRTRTGVETVNIDNSDREAFDNSFHDESRRLIEERLRAGMLRRNQARPQDGESTEHSSAPPSTATINEEQIHFENDNSGQES